MSFPGRTDTTTFQCPVCFVANRKTPGKMSQHDRTSWTAAKTTGGMKRKAVFCNGSGMQAVERKW